MLTPDDLRAIADRYHRTDWSGFDPTVAVFDIGRLMGHITLQAECIAALDAAARAVVAQETVTYASGDLRSCSRCGDRRWEDGHADDCAFGALAALLDGDA